MIDNLITLVTAFGVAIATLLLFWFITWLIIVMIEALVCCFWWVTSKTGDLLQMVARRIGKQGYRR